jgi:urease gamma subunit
LENESDIRKRTVAYQWHASRIAIGRKRRGVEIDKLTGNPLVSSYIPAVVDGPSVVNLLSYGRAKRSWLGVVKHHGFPGAYATLF